MSLPPAYTSYPPFLSPNSQHEPTRYRVEGNSVYAQVPVYPNSTPQAQSQNLVPCHHHPPVASSPAAYGYPYHVPYPAPMAALAPAQVYCTPPPATYIMPPSYSTLALPQVPYLSPPSSVPPGHKLKVPTANKPFWTAEPIDSDSENESWNGKRIIKLTCKDPEKERRKQKEEERKKKEKEERKKAKARGKVIRVVFL